MDMIEFFDEEVSFGGPPTPATWWSGYRSVLGAEGFGASSIEVIDVDSAFIVDEGVLGAGGPDGVAWPEGRVRTGVVVGAVQSGKTASMMAVAARALDSGVDILVVLAGTRTSLWLQTFDRFGTQLDTWKSKHSHRLLRPNIAVPAPTEIPAVPGLYTMQKAAVKKAFAKGWPIVVIAMKQVDHLERLGTALRDVVYPAASEMGREIHLVVIDDEADDASVADPLSLVPSVQAKQVPLRIVELWGDRRSPWNTVGDHVRATYVAYTATPQANFLQDSSNPLAPRDFAVALRTPGPSGVLAPRSGTFREPGGLRS